MKQYVFMDGDQPIGDPKDISRIMDQIEDEGFVTEGESILRVMTILHKLEKGEAWGIRCNGQLFVVECV